MKCIVGLGNPGTQYEHTRHNIGFLVVDEMAKLIGAEFRSKRSLEAEIAEGQFEGERVLLVKPQTFMNVSGRSVADILKKYPISNQDLLIVYDDADLPFGDVRFKAGGTSAGHRGMESIIETLGRSVSVPRVRFGIGRPHHPDIPLEDFVLTKWNKEQESMLPAAITKAIETIRSTFDSHE